MKTQEITSWGRVPHQVASNNTIGIGEFTSQVHKALGHRLSEDRYMMLWENPKGFPLTCLQEVH